MKKSKQRKPTMKEMETAMSNLIMETKRSQIEIIRTQRVLNDFIEYKKETEPFTKYVEEKYEERDKKDSKKNTNRK